MANPFLQRNLPLSELLQMQQRYSGEGNNGWYQQAQLRNTNEAIDQLGRRRQPMMQPRPQPMPRAMQPRPTQPRPQPMQQRPQQMQPRPQPMMPSMPGIVGTAGMGPSTGVSVTSGLGGALPPMAWNALGLGGGGGGMPMMAGGGMPGYGTAGGMNFGGGFRGFTPQQPYQAFR